MSGGAVLRVTSYGYGAIKENGFTLMGVAVAGKSERRRQRRISFIRNHCNNNSNSNEVCAVSGISSERRSASSSEERVYEVVMKQVSLVEQHKLKDLNLNVNVMEKKKKKKKKKEGFVVQEGGGDFYTKENLLTDAYDQCGYICAEYANTFYLGTKLMTPEHRKAIWAIAVWCRRTDELVDGANSSVISSEALDCWEQRLIDIFDGRPYDIYDAALSHTVSNYPLHIQPFKDMIEGMRMDLRKSRYRNFEELYLYCYHVAGTVALMCVPVMGTSPQSKASILSVYNSALAFGFANQLTNILRDVGEDARRGRVYLPQDELAQAGLSDDDIYQGRVTDKWREFMKGQIKRARMFYAEAEKGVAELNSGSRWPVWASLMLYRQILDAIEANDYNNFTKKACVGKARKLLSLPGAFGRALLGY